MKMKMRMKTRTLQFALLTGCVASAAVGWCIGKGGRVEPPARDPAGRAISLLNSSAKSHAILISGDYGEVARGEVRLRGQRDADAVGEFFGKSRCATKLGADPVALGMIAELHFEEIIALLPRLLEEEPMQERLIAAALGQWARSDPQQALDWASAYLDRAAFTQARTSIVAAWAESDPAAALSWLREKLAAAARKDRHQLSTDYNAILTVWAQNDPAAALQVVLQPESSVGVHAWHGFSQIVHQDSQRDIAFDLVLGIEDEAARQKGLESLLLAWGKNDPAAAARWLDKNGYTDKGTQWAVSQRYQRLDPAANADWLFGRVMPENREQTLTTAIAYWARADPTAAGDWVEASGISLDGVAEQLANTLYRGSPARAMAWAMRIEDENRRRMTIGSVLRRLLNLSRLAGGSEEAFDYQSFTAATGMTVEELAKLSDEAAKSARSRW